MIPGMIRGRLRPRFFDRLEHHPSRVPCPFHCLRPCPCRGRPSIFDHPADFRSEPVPLTGTGSFSQDCRTLFIGELKFNRSDSKFLETAYEILMREFGMFGAIDNLRIIQLKNIGFIKFKHRAACEFAKIALQDQKIPKITDCLTVKWAHSDPNPKSKAQDEAELTQRVEQAVYRRFKQLGYTDEEISRSAEWSTTSGVTALYPSAEEGEEGEGGEEGGGGEGGGDAAASTAALPYSRAEMAYDPRTCYVTAAPAAAAAADGSDPDIAALAAQQQQQLIIDSVNRMQSALDQIGTQKGQDDSSMFNVAV
eukprot:GHVU01071575.1.p1 GENE.GHVU01071575.1~~GHVU01071575.1.p1  ORF type:complete len:309 (-),score=72.34 GHVU01071575.1:434-1360(-)